MRELKLNTSKKQELLGELGKTHVPNKRENEIISTVQLPAALASY
jgi:hypothetical protein